MRCKTCHYSLANLPGPEHRCPECGYPFDPNDPSTFEDESLRGMSAMRWGAIIGAIGFLAGVIGPILLSPSSNQGPLLGFFITGPLGFVVGVIFGWIRQAMR
jgi:hypothetical protein